MYFISRRKANHMTLARQPEGLATETSGCRGKEKEKQNESQRRAKSGLFFNLSRLFQQGLTRAYEKSQIKSEISRLSSNVFCSCLRRDREGRQGRVKTEDRVRTSENHLTVVGRKWRGRFLSEDMIELERAAVSTASRTGQQREE